MSDQQSTHGTIWAVFAHRLAVEGPDGRVLVDLGPEGAKGLTLNPGDRISVTGERKPSEIKAASVTLADGTRRAIPWGKPEHHAGPDHGPADPAVALAALQAAGYGIAGEAKRRPKHFEVPVTKDGDAFEAHVTLDGAIRKTKVLSASLPTPA